MKTHVRLFASYREWAGGDHFDLTLEDGATVAAAVVSLLAKVPSLPSDFKPHLIAVNEEFANLDYPLHDGDEVALYPPVSGGVDARIVHGTIDAGALANTVRRPENGAVVTFEGVTRDNTGGRRVLRLEYEAHDSMAEKVLGQVLTETAVRFGLEGIAGRHRIGMLKIGEASLVVAIGAPHRMEAFLAGQYAVDRIKHVVPVWKREFFEDGQVWVGEACDPVTHANHLAEAPYSRFLLGRESLLL